MRAASPLLRHTRPLPWLLLLALAAGCSSIRILPADHPTPFDDWRASALTCCDLSPRTRQTLRKWAVEELYEKSPRDAAAQLHAVAVRAPDPDILFALAEINYVRGQKAEEEGQPNAVAFYYLCAGYAYHFLFPDGEGETTPAFDPRFRLACDLYNAGLARCIASAQQAGTLDPRRELRLPTPDGKEFVLEVTHEGFGWRPEEFGALLSCADYKVEGLANHHRTYGLGVPLIGTRVAASPRPGDSFYPPSVSFPVTAFFRFGGTLTELRERRAGRLHLINPLEVQTVRVRGRAVPLESDLTTPLAHYLAHARLEASGYTGFFCPDCLADRTGLHTLEPYRPGKVPVVLIHGLLGSPLTWAPMYNDLLADPVLRRRYQFWVYFYPTGNPYLASAADLRADLARLRKELDPEGRDEAFEQMVVIGHSMGGLVTRLLTVDGGDDFWKLASDVPFDSLNLPADARAELRQTFFFERQPWVKRAIFLGTPHRGSRISPSFVGRLGARLAGVPRMLMDTAREVAEANPDFAKALAGKRIPTSIDLLSPDSPAIRLVSHRPRPEGVHYHSVVGIAPASSLVIERWLGGAGRCEPSDGVVPYSSAHLEEAESEVIVPADHYTVHQHPQGILEVRRILLEHLKEVDAHSDPGVVPAGRREVSSRQVSP
jgi:pimeloyl-ACP methyl ester carboxylesterase